MWAAVACTAVAAPVEPMEQTPHKPLFTVMSESHMPATTRCPSCDAQLTPTAAESAASHLLSTGLSARQNWLTGHPAAGRRGCRQTAARHTCGGQQQPAASWELCSLGVGGAQAEAAQQQVCNASASIPSCNSTLASMQSIHPALPQINCSPRVAHKLGVAVGCVVQVHATNLPGQVRGTGSHPCTPWQVAGGSQMLGAGCQMLRSWAAAKCAGWLGWSDLRQSDSMLPTACRLFPKQTSPPTALTPRHRQHLTPPNSNSPA